MISKKGYYSNIDIRYEIIKQLMHRETCFINYNTERRTAPNRWLNASALRFFDMHTKRYKFYQQRMNLYHSLAKYKDFPTFSYDYKKKRDQQKQWNKDFDKHLISYDCFLETDSLNLVDSFRDAIKIKVFLDKFDVCYCCGFSGSKGVHFIIAYEEFKHIDVPIYSRDNNAKSMVKIFKDLAVSIKEVYDLPTMDVSVQDIKRVKKCFYSYDVKSGLIAYPLTDDMLLNFDKSMVTPEKVITYNNHKRGLLWRNTEHTKEHRQKKIDEMLKFMEI